MSNLESAKRTLLAGERVVDLLNILADAPDGECYCREHDGECPGGDCAGCAYCPSGRARSILVAMGLA